MMLKRFGLMPAPCLALLLPVVGHAERHNDERGGREHQHFDVRHGHNHYYPDRGMVVPMVPRAAVVVRFGDGRFWFHEGVWF